MSIFLLAYIIVRHDCPTAVMTWLKSSLPSDGLHIISRHHHCRFLPVVVVESSSSSGPFRVGRSLPSFRVWFLRRVCRRRRRRRSSLVVVSLCPPPRDSGVSTPVVTSVVVVVVFSTWRPSSSSSSSVAVVVVVSCSCRLFPLTTYRPPVTSFPLKLERYAEEADRELCRQLRCRQGCQG